MSVSVRRRVIAGLTGAACAALFVTACSQEKPSSLSAQRTAVREVDLVEAEVRPMEKVVVVAGNLGAQERSIVSAKVGGRLQTINVDIGSPVKKGEVLAQIEPRDYEIQLREAEAALDQARASVGLPAGKDDVTVRVEEVSTVKQAWAVLQEAISNRERIRSLSQSGISSQSEVDTVEANYRVALNRHQAALEDARVRIATVGQRRAELEFAAKQLADTSVRAPFDGSVQSRQAGLGQFVPAGSPVLELVKTDPLRLRLNVPERHSAMVQVGKQVRLLAEGDTNLYTGTLARVSPALDEQSRTLLVEADVPARGSLRAGLFARAELVISENEPGLAVPLSCLTVFAGLEKVIVAEKGKASERLVSTGRRGSNWVEIVSGLSPGESVILKPAGLRTGSLISVRAPAVHEGGSAHTRATDS